MIIPSYVTIYHKGRKLRTGSECPKEHEEALKLAIESTLTKAKALGEALADHDGEDKKILDRCSRYPEYCVAAGRAYHETRRGRAAKATPKKEKKKDD